MAYLSGRQVAKGRTAKFPRTSRHQTGPLGSKFCRLSASSKLSILWNVHHADSSYASSRHAGQQHLHASASHDLRRATSAQAQNPGASESACLGLIGGSCERTCTILPRNSVRLTLWLPKPAPPRRPTEGASKPSPVTVIPFAIKSSSSCSASMQQEREPELAGTFARKDCFC